MMPPSETLPTIADRTEATGNTPFAAPRFDLVTGRGEPVALTPVGDDAAALGALVAGVDPWRTSGWPAEAIAARLVAQEPGARTFAVRLEDRPVGAVIVRTPFMRGPYLELLALAETTHGRGIGRAIIDWMAGEVAAVPREANLWLCVSDWNAPAVGFYRAVGFVEVGPLPDLAVVGSTELFMRKVLRAPAAPAAFAPTSMPPGTGA